VEIDAATAQLGEITLHPTKCRIELHSHRHHAVARHYAGIPDLAPPVSVLVVVPIGLYVLAGDFTDLRRTGEVLILVRGQHFPLNIGKVKIVERTAIEYGNDESAGAAIGELASRMKYAVSWSTVPRVCSTATSKGRSSEGGAEALITAPSRR